MARGFGATYGVDSTNDAVDLAYTGNPTVRTWYFRWLDQDGISAFARMIGKYTTTTQVTSIVLENGSNYATPLMSFRQLWSGANATWTWNFTTGANTWHDCLLTYDQSSTANDPVVYIDGSAVTVTETATPSGTLTTSTEALRCGNWAAAIVGGSGGRVPKGKMAEVAVWSRALTAAEAAALARGYSPDHFPNSLEEYVPLIRSLGSKKLATATATGTAVQPHPRTIQRAPWRASFIAAAVSATVRQLAALGAG